MATPNHSASSAKEMTIDIPMDEGDPLGAFPDEHLIIQTIQPGTIADGRLQVGDQILKIKGIKIRDRNHFFQLLRYAPPNAILTVLRNVHKVPVVDPNIPEDREKLITRCSGFTYLLAKVSIPIGQRLGLFLRSYQNRVLVSKVEAGSHSDGNIMALDHIIDINGVRVSDKRAAAVLITQFIRQEGRFTCIIGRPTTDATKKQIEEDIHKKNDPPSERFSMDVCQIAEEERRRMQTTTDGPLPSCLRMPDAPAPTRNVTFNETANERFLIGNDNVGRTLNPVNM